MSVCDPGEGMHSLFAGVLERQAMAEVPVDETGFAALEALIAQERDGLAALIIEPLVQCAGGFRMHSPATLRRIVGTARAAGLLVICDEIATGFGRTGTLFACEQAGVVPDIVTLSKALTGGTLPLAATVARSHVYEAFLSDRDAAALMHGPTYSGNPLACAAANASLELFRTEPRLAQVRAIEARLRAGLEICRGLPRVADVRVQGAIGVIEFESQFDRDRMRSAFIDAGVWIRPFGRVVYLMPALNIPADELGQLIDAIVRFGR
jgi:adenosylmethionine-8-amino-7-oxononanoate aminotransferase